MSKSRQKSDRPAQRREQGVPAEAEAAKQRLEAVLRAISDCFIALDRDWRYVTVNDRACEGMGVDLDEILGQRIWDIRPETIGTQFETELRRAASEQKTAVFEFYQPAQKRWYENRVFPAADGILLFYTDITERKRTEEALRQSEERFRRYFDLGLVGMAITSPTKGCLDVNAETCRILGYSREELLQKTWAHIRMDWPLDHGLTSPPVHCLSSESAPVRGTSDRPCRCSLSAERGVAPLPALSYTCASPDALSPRLVDLAPLQSERQAAPVPRACL